MLKTTKFLTATALAALIAAPANAETLEYLGPSFAAAPGDAGVLGFTALCEATYVGSQFCFSSDILRSLKVLSERSTTKGMWVMPDIRGYASDGSLLFAIDASGVVGTKLSCDGWGSKEPTRTGLAPTWSGTVGASRSSLPRWQSLGGCSRRFCG